MVDFLNNSDFSGDSFSVPSERVKAVDLLGYGYSIPDFYWRVEMLLPYQYEIERLVLREFWTAERQVSWPEVDMLINLDKDILPIGWRVVWSLYYKQDLIPLEWLNRLIAGGTIAFPYAACYWRGKGSKVSTICCPAFSYEDGIIECRGVDRFSVAPVSHIALYQQR